MTLDNQKRELLAKKALEHLRSAHNDNFDYGDVMGWRLSEADRQPVVAASYEASIDKHEAAADLAAKMLGFNGRTEVEEIRNFAEKHQLNPVQVIAARLPN